MIKRTHDIDAIKKILSNKTISEAIIEDGFSVDRINIDTASHCWLMASYDGINVGVYQFIPRNSVTLEVHAHILPAFRKPYSYSSAMEAYRWLLDSNYKYEKLIAEVPAVHGNVIGFCERVGMTHEGTNRLSYKKGGKVINQELLGITFKEMKEFLDE